MKCVLEAKATVGECPRWHPLEKALYWVDIYEPSLNRFDPRTGENRKWPMPERIGCFGFRRGGGFIAGMQSGIFLVDVEKEVTTHRIFAYEPGNPESRFNDGRCDPGGRFWAGTMNESMDKRVGALFRVDHDLKCTKMVDHLIVPNGMAFSPDGRTMYHSDSRQDYVFAWDFNAATGDIANQRIFLAMDIQEGRPDGAAVDAEGYYWICHIGGWHLARYSPEGKIDRVIGIPVQRPTMCAFGGPDLKTLYITTAKYPLSETALRKQPLAGGLFAFDAGVAGIPEPFFGA
jgi:sugar lactone lactonase YvrE